MPQLASSTTNRHNSSNKQRLVSTPLVVAICLAPLWLLAAVALWRINALVDLQQRQQRQASAILPNNDQHHYSSHSLHLNLHQQQQQQQPYYDPGNPLSIPLGQPPNLPSVQVEQEQDNVDHKRRQYGGKGDGQHLGGFTKFDIKGLAPAVWRHMMNDFNIRSLMDVGCGKGVSTLWFALQGLDVLCVEGSHDAVQQSLLEPNQIVEHDYSRGPWWPAKTYDAVWSVEFLEHVGINFAFNYVSTFRKAAILFVTSSRWGGWHHVEVHKDDWWIRKFTSYGFVYDHNLTEQVKYWVDKEDRRNQTAVAPNGEHYNPANIGLTVKVFVNPAVASLPQHAHLFFEHGCYKGFENGVRLTRPCDASKMESVLPPDFLPRPVDWAKHEEWDRRIKQHIGLLPSNGKE